MNSPTDNSTLQAFFEQYRLSVNSQLEAKLKGYSKECEHLQAAMKYCLLNGGKRVRPLLCYASHIASGGTPSEHTHRAATAIECIHVYSLIHDDLPAMDDDDLRRGKASCHIAFDEATAILAGDALQCLAFETLSHPDVPEQLAIRLIRELSHAAGAKGMVLGQSIDLASADTDISLAQLEQMHRYKTGALIEAAVVMGGLCAGAAVHHLEARPYDEPSHIDALRQYARAIGLAFQIKDDILDVTSDTETLGKQQGADEALNKSTYVKLLGLEAAEQKCQDLLQDAMQALDGLPAPQLLKDIALYIIKREH